MTSPSGNINRRLKLLQKIFPNVYYLKMGKNNLQNKNIIAKGPLEHNSQMVGMNQ